MNIAVHKVSESTVLEVLESRLGADKAVGFRDAVIKHFPEEPTSIVLDMARVDFIDSSGLGAILGVLKRLPKGSELLICGTTPPVLALFKLTRMDRVFTICGTVDEAVAVLSR